MGAALCCCVGGSHACLLFVQPVATSLSPSPRITLRVIIFPHPSPSIVYPRHLPIIPPVVSPSHSSSCVILCPLLVFTPLCVISTLVDVRKTWLGSVVVIANPQACESYSPHCCTPRLNASCPSLWTQLGEGATTRPAPNPLRHTTDPVRCSWF